MSLLHEAIQEKKFDVRMVEKNITRGAVTEKEAKAARDAMPDDAENAAFTSLDDLEAND